MNKIKILYGLEATDYGAMKHLSYLIKHINKNIFDITVILSPARSDRVYSEIDKIKSNGARVIMLKMNRRISLFNDLHCLLKLTLHIRKDRYDIVHAHSSKAGVLFRIAGAINSIPLILYTPHSFYFQGLKGLKRKVFVWLERILSWVTDHIIISDNETKYAIECTHQLSKKPVNINNTIDTAEYTRVVDTRSIKTKLKIKDGIKIITTVGRITTQKNFLAFVRMAAHVLNQRKDVAFLIAGDGEMEAEIKTAIDKHGLSEQIILTGYCQNISEIYSITDIFVSTSLWEGMPYVILEAILFDIPVVASNIGHTVFPVLTNKFYTVDASDHLSMADTVITLLNKPNEATLPEQRKPDTFSITDFVVSHEIIYKHVSDKWKPKHPACNLLSKKPATSTLTNRFSKQ